MKPLITGKYRIRIFNKYGDEIFERSSNNSIDDDLKNNLATALTVKGTDWSTAADNKIPFEGTGMAASYVSVNWGANTDVSTYAGKWAIAVTGTNNSAASSKAIMAALTQPAFDDGNDKITFSSNLTGVVGTHISAEAGNLNSFDASGGSNVGDVVWNILWATFDINPDITITATDTLQIDWTVNLVDAN